MICNHCSERSGVPSTTKINDETITQKVGEMSGFTRMSDGEVDGEDLKVAAKNIEFFLRSYYKIMYTRHQKLWRIYVAKEQIEDEYNDISIVKFFNEIKERCPPNTIWVIFSCINTDFIERLGVNLTGLPCLKKFLKLQASKYVAKKSDTFTPQKIEKVLLHLQGSNCNMLKIGRRKTWVKLTLT